MITLEDRVAIRNAVKALHSNFPEIVTLCGSTRFKAEYEWEQARLSDEGIIVISVSRFGHVDGLDMDGPKKKALDELHLRKIDLADRIHVINPCVRVCPQCRTVWPYNSIRVEKCGCGAEIGHVPPAPYIGSSTRNEITYALANGKRVTYLEPMP